MCHLPENRVRTPPTSRPARLLYAIELMWLTFAGKSGTATAVVAVAVPMPLCSVVLHSLSVRAAAHTPTVTPPTFYKLGGVSGQPETPPGYAPACNAYLSTGISMQTLMTICLSLIKGLTHGVLMVGVF